MKVLWTLMGGLWKGHQENIAAASLPGGTQESCTTTEEARKPLPGAVENAPSYSNTALSPQAGDKDRSFQYHIFFSKAVHNLNRH